MSWMSVILKENKVICSSACISVIIYPNSIDPYNKVPYSWLWGNWGAKVIAKYLLTGAVIVYIYIYIYICIWNYLNR